jgi:hypothetical protein
MFSYALWRSLRRPPTRNPLFRQTYTHAEEAAPWYVGCVQWTGLLFFAPIIALAGLVYGFGWSVGIAGTLGKERESRRFELIRLTPPGPLGMSWAGALGYLYHHRTFRNVNTNSNLLIRTGLMAFILSGVGLAVETQGFTFMPSFANIVLYLVTLFAALLVDHVQSVVVAVLTGILAADAAGSRFGAQLVAFSLYSGVQIITYLVSLTLGVSLSVLAANEAGLLLVLVVRLVLFAAVRELLIWLLWRRLDHTLAPDIYEQWILLGRTPRKANP